MADKAEKIALFIDFENLETGVRKQFDARVDIELVMNKLENTGTIGVQRAYADWVQHTSYRQPLIQAGIELIERTNISPGRNGSDVKLAIDAVEAALRCCSAETFAIVSGNSDFVPLIHKLKELGKTVVVFGVDACTENLIKKTADFYVSYESLTGAAPAPSSAPEARRAPEKKSSGGKPQRIPNDMLKTIAKILTENPDYKLDSEKLKVELIKKYSGFDESVYGSNSFGDLLEFVNKKKLLPIKTSKQGGKLMVQLIDEAAKKEKEEQWEDREMTEKEWEFFMEAVEGCVNEGAGRANQGKLWIINAYLHRKRVDGILPLSNNILFGALQALTEYGALRRTDNDCYLLTEDYEFKKEDFLDELFGVEIDEEYEDASEEAVAEDAAAEEAVAE